MRKDIFIDAQIANTFAGSNLCQHVKDLIDWLLTIDPINHDNEAHLVSSQYIRAEYWGGNNHCLKEYSIVSIYTELQKRDRINFKGKEEIEKFKRENISKKKWGKLKSKENDKNHIPLVFLSDRKMVLSNDNSFIEDLINFPKFGNDVKLARTPKDLNYK